MRLELPTFVLSNHLSYINILNITFHTNLNAAQIGLLFMTALSGRSVCVGLAVVYSPAAAEAQRMCVGFAPISSDQRTLYHLNLTSLQDLEIILSATFHFLFNRRPRPSAWFCKHYKTLPCRSLRLHSASSIHLLLRSDPSGSEVNPGSHGSLLGSMTFHPHQRGSWQIRDVTTAIKEAREKGSHFVSVEVDFGMQYHRKPEDMLSEASLPYLLVYTDDQELDEPNSLAQTLQRYDPEAEEESPHRSLLHAKLGSKDHVTREVQSLPYSIQNNELPEVEYRPRERDGGGNEGGSKSPMLSFDEPTLHKARRRQWGLKPQVRSCSRRTLRVDFADIGWSEWVLAPKAFDCYYCAGTCGFPIPKMQHPSNHATIQSIVRAVGIVPGVPEPCCVPEKMSPLGVLYQDEGGNLVLKVYPGMSVESCSCR
uniref:Growth/differentiation factor 10 n=1 Tax=Hucho hucho TaxID=62062 RepID=A0A4W5LR56_9TELE